ncbi:hypothetical protein V5N11_020015 [Cardamine amara subsp. amara]|uniref:Reverse transcriptase zinc-binding domain-containing protein n=1 Tax=Cardamine amara subsp. amara TaxID=228776 RepID=A0ABD0ZJR9_CARAN
MAFWKLGINPKLQHFFWRVITSSILTATRLLTRKVNIDPMCQWRCLEEETINHVLFLCPHAQNIWRCSNVPSQRLQQPSQILEDNLWLLLEFHCTSNLPIELHLLPFWTT